MRPTRGSSRLVVSLLTLLAIVVVCGQNAAADVDEFDWSRTSQSLPCDLADALQWQPHLPAAALRRAVSYKGDMLRLDMFLYKLVVQRLAVTVAVVGGPVTFLSAGHRGPQPVLFNQGLYGTTGERSHSPPQGWLSAALDNLIRAFPPRHLKQWRAPGQSKSAVVAEPYWLINLGLPHGSLATWASCDGATFLQSLPGDVDLVIAELALSDQGEAKGQGAGSFLQMYDSVLQQLLLRWGGGAPQNPPQTRQWQKGRGGLEGVKAAAGAAVVMVNFFSFCRGNQACRQQEDPSLSFADVGPFSFGLPPHHPAYPHRAPEVVSEDNITVLAQYYSLPVLSTRDAFFTLLGHQAPGYRLKDVVTTGPSSLPLHVEPDTLASAIPPAAAVADGAGDFDGTLPVDSIDPHALSGVLPTALQAKTKYADVITALFHSALKGKSACSQHLSIMAFDPLQSPPHPTGLIKRLTKIHPPALPAAPPATLRLIDWLAEIHEDNATLSPSCRPCFQPPNTLCDLSSTPTGLMDRLREIHEDNATLSSSCRPRFQPPNTLCDLSSTPTGLIDRLEEINADNDTHSLLPFLLRPPPPFFARWLHSTAASAFLRPALPHACFSFRPGAVAPPVLGLQGFILQSIGLEHGTKGRGRPGLVALDDDSWVEFVINTAIPLTTSSGTSNLQPIQLTTIPTVVEISYLAHANGSSIFGKLQCVEGCKCTGVVVTALSASPVPLKESRLLLVSRNHACVMRVQGSRGFHVLGVTVHSVMQQQQDQQTHAMRQIM
ncbi:unnamed protein product [Closterium sp. NIES-65]|nr:unnamed protein product [Closterium sp. NIES-65]